MSAAFGAGTLLATAMAGPVMAQTAPANADDSTTVQTVVVTGSRLPRLNLDQPTPVSVLSSAQIQNSGVTNLGDILSQIPALGFAGSIRGNENGGQASGLDIPNLRNLGANRTLTLVDGQRHVPGAAGAAGVDLNSIPPTLVDHVEVTTGGASAIYGSDAVTGVVNIITKKKLDGIEADISGGTAFGGYDKSINASISVGGKFDEDRGHAIFSLIYDHSDAVSSDQIKALKNAGSIANFADCATPKPLTSYTPCTPIPNDGIPDRLIVPNVGSELIGQYGVLDNPFTGVTPPFIGFTANGTPVLNPTRSGYNNNAFGQLPYPCNGCFFGQDFVNIVPEITRRGFFTNLNYELTPDIELTFDAKYVNTENYSIFQPSFVFESISPNDGLQKTFSTSIKPDNAFRTAALNSFINSAYGQNLNNVSLPYAAFIGPPRGDTTTRETYRLVTGANGRFNTPFAEFHFDTALNYGETNNSFTDRGELIDGNFRASLDSVIDPTTGKAACRINVPSAQPTGYAAPTGITQAYNRCVPFNPFGAQNSAAFYQWAQANLAESQKVTQEVANANFRFDTSRFYKLQGGAIDVAFGTEYRKETSNNVNDPLALQGLTFRAASPSAPGTFNVYEGYAEVSAPVFKNVRFAEELTLGAAMRQAHYQPFGDVNTWNLNAVYEPFARNLEGWYKPLSGIKFRGTLSSATRAPNIDEAFRPTSPGFANITDPCDASNIGLNKFRAANCAALGIPTGFRSATAQSINTISSGGDLNGGHLRNETAHTYTLGVTYQPTWLPNFSATMDYYNINILDAITLPTTQTIINNCVDGPALSSQFCSLVQRYAASDPKANNIQTVTSQFLNAAAQQTHGVDFQVNYSHGVAEWTRGLPVVNRLDGRLSAGFNMNWTIANRNTPFAQFPGIQNVFEGTVGIPAERGTLDLNYNQGDLSLGWRTRFVSRSALFNRDATQIEHCEAISQCQVPTTFYSDVSFNYRLKTPAGKAEIYGGIKNLFDKQIPLWGYTTNPEYEIFGATAFLGVRLKH